MHPPGPSPTCSTRSAPSLLSPITITSSSGVRNLVQSCVPAGGHNRSLRYTPQKDRPAAWGREVAHGKCALLLPGQHRCSAQEQYRAPARARPHTGRHPAEKVLGCHHRQRVGARRAVERGHDRRAARLGEVRQRGAEVGQRLDVLDHLARDDCARGWEEQGRLGTPVLGPGDPQGASYAMCIPSRQGIWRALLQWP